MFQYKELETCSHVFLRRIAFAPPLTALYDGSYKVIFRSGRVLKILMKGKGVTVTVDRVKAAHFEREPVTGNTTQRQTNPKPKSTTPKPVAIARKPQADRARSSSTNTKSFRTGVNANMSTKTWSSHFGVETSPAIALQSETTRAHLPRPPAFYKAPHSRTTRTVGFSNVLTHTFTFAK